MLFNQFLKGHKVFVEEQRKVQGSAGKSSLTISAKQDGVGAVSQRSIPTGERSWIADAHRGDGKRFVARADEKVLKRVQKSFELLLLLISQFLIVPGQIYVACLRPHFMLADRFVERERGAVM